MPYLEPDAYSLKDNDLQVYGMRVVEPHHDGTPNWHMLLFCKPEQRKHITEIMRRYALKEDGDEKVQQHRDLKRSTSIKVVQPVTSQNTLRRISTGTHSMGRSITIPVDLSLMLQQL
ncbi:bacteriophage replication protein A family protein [Citrobacter koseri]|nr:bacteriophage replication protein A family protein [Citrobacter koseri]KWZ99538.1 bacteriophage replication protein A family protein [Citrobacter koseri]KXB41024.1 bacteriophage replication protein A family protein [Citrobacter koseri]